MEEMGTCSGNLWGLLVEEMGMPNVKEGDFQWKRWGPAVEIYGDF
jgi:hypothetical protein